MSTPQADLFYQVDWSNQAAGKRVAATKKKVTFRFGIANARALANSEIGTAARGEEHEVVLVWSLTSGKRLLTFNGREVHFSKGGKLDGCFDTNFMLKNGHTCKVVAFAAPPMSHVPGFRQFDMQIDGLSFFDMPKIYELGVKHARGSPSRALSPRSVATSGYSNYDYGKETSTCAAPGFAQAPARRSVPSMDDGASRKAPQKEELKTVPPADVPAPDLLLDAAPTTTSHDLISGPSSTSTTHALLTAPSQDEFAPQEPPSPTFADVTNSILATYGPKPTEPAPLALTNVPHNYYDPATHQYQDPANQHAPGYYYPHQTQQQPAGYHYQNQQPQYMPVTPESAYTPTREEEAARELAERVTQPRFVTPTMAPMTVEELDALREQTPAMSPMEKAVHSLVNLDNLDETKETPETLKAKREREARAPLKSTPKPPCKPGWQAGMNATLQDIATTATKIAPTKEVMRTHAFDPAAAQAGMMVLYGSGGGIPQAQGFGAGVHASFSRQLTSYGQQMAYRPQMQLPQTSAAVAAPMPQQLPPQQMAGY